MGETGDVEQLDFSGLSEDAMSAFFSSIGANGTSVFLIAALQSAESEDDLGTVASLSRIRHGLLQSNLEFFTAS